MKSASCKYTILQLSAAGRKLVRLERVEKQENNRAKAFQNQNTTCNQMGPAQRVAWPRVTRLTSRVLSFRKIRSHILCMSGSEVTALTQLLDPLLPVYSAHSVAKQVSQTLRRCCSCISEHIKTRTVSFRTRATPKHKTKEAHSRCVPVLLISEH